MTLFIPLGTGSTWQDNELRYALRSWEMYSPPTEVVIIGPHKPKWLTNVRFIEWPYHYNKPKDIFMKTKFMATQAEQFIFANDDHFLLAPFREEYEHAGPIARYKAGSEAFRRYVSNTAQLFPQGNFFDVHTPVVMDSEIVKRLEYPQHDILLKSLYCNTAGIEGFQGSDFKLNRHVRSWDIDELLAGRWVFSVGEVGMQSVDLREWLHNRFPEPSKCEIQNYQSNN